MSRPEKPIDWKLVDDLLMAGCLGTEIAPHFDLHPTTFYGRVEDRYGMSFTNYSTEKRAQGDSCLRAKQYEKAMNNDTTMLIWLGKQRLEQREPEAVQKKSEATESMKISVQGLDNAGAQLLSQASNELPSGKGEN